MLVITNAAAGGSSRVEAALAVLRGASPGVEVVATSTAAECDAAVARLGQRRVVICGGDGSVHTVVEALHRADALDRPVGLIPLGTGNDLARAIGLPLDPAAAARVVLDGRPRRLDLLVDDTGGVVVNAVHLGVGAEAARRAASLKPRLGRLAYLFGGVSAGLAAPGWTLTVRVDGSPLASGRVLQVGIGLGRSVGGGSPLTPHSVLDDQQADVVVSEAVGFLARLGYGLRLRRGSHVDRPDVRTARGATVEADGDPFHYNADGEIHGPVPRRVWTIDPRGWNLVTPP